MLHYFEPRRTTNAKPFVDGQLDVLDIFGVRRFEGLDVLGVRRLEGLHLSSEGLHLSFESLHLYSEGVHFLVLLLRIIFQLSYFAL